MRAVRPFDAEGYSKSRLMSTLHTYNRCSNTVHPASRRCTVVVVTCTTHEGVHRDDDHDKIRHGGHAALDADGLTSTPTGPSTTEFVEWVLKRHI